MTGIGSHDRSQQYLLAVKPGLHGTFERPPSGPRCRQGTASASGIRGGGQVVDGAELQRALGGARLGGEGHGIVKAMTVVIKMTKEVDLLRLNAVILNVGSVCSSKYATG